MNVLAKGWTSPAVQSLWWLPVAVVAGGVLLACATYVRRTGASARTGLHLALRRCPDSLGARIARGATPDPPLRHIAARALADAGYGRAVAVSEPPAGRSNRVFAVTLADGRPVVARLPRRGGSRFRMERAVMRAAADAGVPVPDVLDILNEEGPGEPVMLLGVVHGAAPDPAALDKDVVAAVGRVLGLIHSLDVGTGYGNLDDELRGSSTSFEEWFVDGIAPAVERACEALAGDTEALAGLHRAANVIAERGPVLAADDAVLLHGDFRPGNLLFDGTELVAVIDWEAAKRGPAGLDLAWWDWAAEGAVLTADALIDGYVQVRPLDTASLGEVRHVATARILIGHLDWAVQTGDAYAAESARERLRAFGGE